MSKQQTLKVPVRCLSCKHEFIFEGYFLEHIFCEKCKGLCEYYEKERQEKYMKYQEVNKPKQIKENQLRVWHIPQVPMHAFYVYVNSIKEAKLVLETLAIYDLFQFEYKIKPDYSNVNGLEIYKDNEWSDYEDEEGNNINDIEI